MYYVLVDGGSTGTANQLDGREIGVQLSAVARNFSLHHNVQTGSGAHQAFFCPMGTEGSFPGVKAVRDEVGHSPPSAEFKNGGFIPPLLRTSQ
jgi:hypothetical protein